jgi:circadian clock protein KaiC
LGVTGTIVCEVCGEHLGPNYKFCSRCGTPAKSLSALRRIPTGNPEIDRILEGGLEKGKSYLIAGETGTGKTIFSLQFLTYGAANGEPGIYVTIDERPEVLISDVRRFGWDLQQYINERRLIILPVRQYFTAKMWGKDMDVIVNNIVGELSRISKSVGAKRLVIDPVAPLVTMNTTEVTYTREYIRSLVFSIEERVGTTSLITSEVPTGEDSISRFGVEEFLASGIIILGIANVDGKLKRTLYVRKMRWTAVDPIRYTFRIERGKGIVIDGVLG